MPTVRDQDVFKQKELGEFLSEMKQFLPRGQYHLNVGDEGKIKISKVKKHYLFRQELEELLPSANQIDS